MLKDELDRLDEDYIEKRYKLLSKIISEQAEYWKQIPLLTYIHEGMGGYGGHHLLFEQHIYTFQNKRVYIDCRTATIVDIVYKDYDMVSDGKISTFIKYERIKNIVYPDAKKEVEYLNSEIDRKTHSDINPIEPQNFILNSIKYDIDLTYLDYNRHYNKSKYVLTEKAFNSFKERITKDYCLKILTE